MNKIGKYTQGKYLLIAAVVLSFFLIAVVVWPVNQGDAIWIIPFIGRFHPLLVHLPIGILLALFVLEVMNVLRPSLQLKPAGGLLLWLGVLCSIPTVLAGKLLAVSGGYGSDVLSIHSWFGLATAILCIWLVVLRKNSIDWKDGKFVRYHLVLFINVFLLAITGHYGGSLTHGSGYLTANLPDKIRILLGDDPYSIEGLANMKTSQINETLETYTYSDHIHPIAKTYCYSCHGEKEQKGGLRLDGLNPDLVQGNDANHWRAILNMVNSAEMPPKDEKQLSDDERKVLVDWITASIQQAVAIRKSEEKTVIRRLTKNQYTNTLQNLLNVSARFGDVLPDDGISEMGFSNNGQVMQISPLHIEYYKQIAREALDKAISPPEKPVVTRYRITFGKGIGKDAPAAMIGGFQSSPIDANDFLVEILNEDDEPVEANDSVDQARIDDIKMNIGIGMRGSDPDRYEVVDEGIVLYSALPHKEVTPRSWQGPSPNLKLLMRDYFPMEGDFRFRVKAAKGYQLYAQKPGFISLRSDAPAEDQAGRIVLKASKAIKPSNLFMKNGFLISKELTANSRAKFMVDIPEEGYYQIDLQHPYVSDDNMPSFFIRLDQHRMQERLHLDKEMQGEKEITTPVTLVYLREGTHQLIVGGRFFVGFSKILFTPFVDTHPIAVQLRSEAEASRIKYEADFPSIRTFAGARTDDGVDYKNFDTYQNVNVPLDSAVDYTFYGRLENLPIPMIDTVETEILANIMVLGLWNDYLVKDNQDSGPPLLVKELEFEAPYYPSWPPKSHEEIFFKSENQPEQEVYTREVLTHFMEKAYRRPLEEGELEPYMRFWSSIRNDYPRYEDGIKEVLIAVLCSPNFIYLAEPEEDTSDDEREFFLASRMSYFLWNSPPDDQLISLAQKGRLHRKRELRKQVKRMIQDERSWHMIRSFAREWLRIDRFESMSTNINEFPMFTRFVKEDMMEETYHFLQHVIQHDLSLHKLIESDFAMLNQNLAEFYGIDSVKGNHFRPVSLPVELHRGGLLSQGAFLNGHSDGTQAHPIKRAVWLKSRILGDKPSDPPPNVPELDPETPGFENLTLKEQLFIHRDKAACMDCHRKIDPYGIVFENYDAVGIFQTVAKERPIDTKAELPNGKVVNGIDDIKSYIIEEQFDVFTRSLVKHLFAYALGRDVTFVDEKEIEMIVAKVRAEDYRIQAVFEQIVTSPSFRGEF